MNLGSTSLSAISGNNNFKTNYSNNRRTNGNNIYRGPSNHSQNVNRNTYPPPDVNKSNMVCDYFKKRRLDTQKISAIDYMIFLQISSSPKEETQDQQQMFISPVKN